MKPDSPLMTRREALRTTFLFSTGAMAAGWAARLHGAETRTAFPAGGMHLLAVGDYGSNNDKQREVARQMGEFAGKLGAPLTAVLALGDNFYGRLVPDQFQPRFEAMYPAKQLDCPFYALLGNHDYGPQYDSKQGPAKADMQLAYARVHPGSRWKMPAKWYSVELGPPSAPLVKLICLDGNFFEGALTPQEKIAQRRWLKQEMAKPTKAKWLWLASHYPVFSETSKKGRGDKPGERLLREWGEYLQQKPISLYLAGHDHNLQHIRMENYDASFLVSGGGGASRYEVKESKRGFSMTTRGFNHIHVTEDEFMVQLVNPDGKCLHAFKRDRAGKTTILT